MPFHLGKPILVMMICGIGAGIASRVTMQPDARADLEIWCFSDQNYKAATGRGKLPNNVALREIAERELGKTVSVKLVQFRAMSARLASLFMSNSRGPELPDLVELEVSGVARYFRPTVGEVGLLPLNDLLEKHGWLGKIQERRLASWSKDGVIFGIPMDVHPAMIAYDDVAFRQAGIDLASSKTWDEFIENGLKFQAYWNKPGQRARRAFEMADANATTLVTMLVQRGINVVDQNGGVHLSDEKTIDTLVYYLRMMIGPRSIGFPSSVGNEAFSQDLPAGSVSAFVAPDWRLKYIKDNAPGEYAGRFRMMPLPRWPDSPHRTSTAGGTSVGIPRNVRDPELSFRLLERMYLSPEAITARTGTNYILPAVKAAWANPKWDEPDPYFGGQPVRRLIAGLAPEVPPRYISPASLVAEVQLAMVLVESLSYVRSHPNVDEATLRLKCQALLNDAQERVKRQVAHGSFE